MALGVSPLVLPIRSYSFSFKPTALISTATVDFTVDASLQAQGQLGGDQIRASVAIDIIDPMFLWLEGTGQLQASADVAFSQTGNIVSLEGAESIAFSISATLTADGSLAGADSIAFGQTATFLEITDAAGATSIAFSESATLQGKKVAQGAVSIDFTSTVDLNATGSLAASPSIAFSEAAGSTFNEAVGGLRFATTVRIGPPPLIIGDLAGAVGLTFSESVKLRGQGIPALRDIFAVYGYTTVKPGLEGVVSMSNEATGQAPVNNDDMIAATIMQDSVYIAGVIPEQV